MYHQPIASFDESGLIFGVMSRDLRTKKNCLKLFDSRNYSAGPFQDIVPESNLLETAMMKSNPLLSGGQIKRSLHSAWNSFEFSTDGNSVLVNTNSDFVYVLDGFRPDVEPMAFYRKNENGLSLGACFAATGNFLVIASEDNNSISLCDTLTAEQKDVMTGHVSPVGCIQHNPRYEQLASGCVNAVLWILKRNIA
jgi:WD40 repeat protein